MKRKIKCLAVALTAVFAMSAFAASAAQANFTAEAKPAAITGISPAGQNHILDTGLRDVECDNAHFAGSLASSAPTLTINFTYTNCRAQPGNLPATVTNTNCAYMLHTTGVGPRLTVECNAGGHVVVDIYSNSSHHTANIIGCQVTIGQQGPLGGISYDNKGAGSGRTVEVTAKEVPVKIAITGSALLCGTATTAKYTGNVNLIAASGGGLASGFDVG